MTEVKFTYRWCRNTKPNVRGEYFLKLRIKIGNGDIWIPVMYLDKKCWDKNKECVTPAHKDHILLNSKLIGIKKEYSDFHIKMIGMKGFVTLDDFARFHKGQHKFEDTFNNYFRNIMLKERTLADNTITNMMQTLRKLNSFRSNIKFEEVTPTLVREFNNFLVSQKLSVNTIGQIHQRLQRIINMAIQDKIIVDTPYQHFRAKTKKVVKEYLLDSELTALENLQPEGLHKTVRDMFLFSSYTGLRVSDVMDLKPSHIRQIGLDTYLIKDTVKTKRTMRLPLNTLFNGKPLQILQQYPDFFPKLPNPKINTILKSLLKEAGITKRITYHGSRHGYFSKLGRETGDLMLITELNGVSIATAMRYTKATDESIKNKLKQINW